MEKSKYVKVSVEEKEFCKIITDFMKILDENEVAMDEITLHLSLKDGTKKTINCFAEFLEFAKTMEKEKKSEKKKR